MKVCPICKKEFLNKKHPKTIFCSNQCRIEARKKTIIKKCFSCKKEFSTIPAWDKKYCSSKCYWKSMKGKPSSNKGLKRTIAQRKTLSEAHKGQVSWNKGKHTANSGSFKKGSKHPNWKGGIIKRFNYVLIWNPKKCKYIYEHRLVMEKIIGRPLRPEEIVHHINEITDDNRPENLMYFPDASSHKKFHYLVKRQSKKQSHN